MLALWSEVRFSARTLRRKPLFSLTVILILVLGIGINTGVFGLLWSLYLSPLPVRELDTLVSLYQTWQGENGEYAGSEGLSYQNFRDYRRWVRTLDDLAIYLRSPMSLEKGDTVEPVMGMYASANYFHLLGLDTARGRFFSQEEEDEAKGAQVVVLSHAAWTRFFNRDPDLVGSTVRINGQEHTVVGIGPQGFRGTELWINVDLWLPVTRFEDLSPYRSLFEFRDVALFSAVGRRAADASVSDVVQEFHRLSTEITEVHFSPPDFMGGGGEPFLSTLLPENSRKRYLHLGASLIGGTVLILLAACLTAANMLLVRGMERDREVAVRQALGARRRTVARELLVEALLLFLTAAVVSLPIAWLTLRLLWDYRPPDFAANAVDLSLHPVAVVFALGLSLAIGLVFGLVPAWRVSRVNLTASLKEGGGGGPVRSWLGLRWQPRNVLVAFQVALALVALVGAGLFHRSVENLRSIDLGFEPDRLAVMRISPGEQGLDETRGRELYRALREHLDSVTGVESVALAENRILRGAVRRFQVFPDGATHAVESPIGSSHRTNVVSPDFFETVGIPLLQGRDFEDNRPPDAPLVAIVNRYMAESVWPGEDPIGQRFRFDRPEISQPLIEVIGVVADARYRELVEEPQFFLYLPLSQDYMETVTVHVRTAGNPEAMLPQLREEIRLVEPSLVVSDLHSMRFYLDGAMWIERLAQLSLGIFGALALLLAVVGIYGVVSYAVHHQRRDLGIRRALGAGRRQVLSEVLTEALGVICVGIVLGWMLAYFALRPFIEELLVDVAGGDPWVYGTQALLLLALALLSSLIPAWGSTRIEPMSVLRDE